MRTGQTGRQADAPTLARRTLAGLLLLAATPAGATLLVYEPFDYDPGVLAGQPAAGQNLTGAYAGSLVPSGFELRVASPGLGYGSLVGAPPSAGNRLSQNLGTTAASATAAVDTDITVDPGQAVFFSALFTFDDSANGNHRASIALTNDENGDEIVFGEPVVGVRAISVFATTAATGGLPIAAGADQSFESGDTLLLVGRYVNAAAAAGDRLELVGYDTLDPGPLPPSFDPADPNAELSFALTGVDIDLAKITSVGFTIRGTANNFIDELRVGSTWADVVPEPGTAPRLLLGLAGLRRHPRRRER
jgi:hypothetical protein